MKTQSRKPETFEEIVFSNRNKEYGAYQIRQEYTRTLSRGLMISITAILVAIAIPLVAGLYRQSGVAKPEITVVGELGKLEDLKKDEIDPPPPPEDTRTMEENARFQAPIVTIDTTNLDPNAFNIDDLLGRKNEYLSIRDTTPSERPEPPAIIETPEPPKTYTVVSEMPEFPGGEMARLKFLKENLVYPREARELGIAGTVYISFIVDEKGRIIDATVIRGPGGGCENEALRVTSMMPLWHPGKQSGIAVRVQFTMPVKFELN